MNTLSPHALNRLQNFSGRLEAANTAVAQMQSLASTYYEQYLALLRALCDQADIDLPLEGVPANVRVDWKTGEVTWSPAEPTNGVVTS